MREISHLRDRTLKVLLGETANLVEQKLSMKDTLALGILSV